MQEIFLKYLEINMEDIKNEFYLNLNDNETEKYIKKDFEILFQDKEKFDLSKIEEFNEKLQKFIELQKDNEEIDLSFVCFHEYYNILDKDSSLTKILQDLNILNYFRNEENKECATINKAFNFGSAIFYKRVEFIRAVFEKQMSFEGVTFEGDINLENSKFIFKNKTDNEIEVSFEGIICNKEAIFNSVEFFHKVSFFRARFYDYTSFKDVTFHDKVDFENTVSKDIFFFHNVKLGKISLIGSHLENANFLRLKDKDKKVLQKGNFQNKDSIRLVKAQYEKENNTTEVNWSFPLEQEFYLDLLSEKKSYYPNKSISKFSLLTHKYISNYGTDWIRVLIILFSFTILASLGYTFFDTNVKEMAFDITERWLLWFEFYYSLILYLLYHTNTNLQEDNKHGLYWLYIWFILFIMVFSFSEAVQIIHNKIATLNNPLNIFKPKKEYFKDIVLYGLFLKAIISTLIYQFVISFRNSTRRK